MITHNTIVALGLNTVEAAIAMSDMTGSPKSQQF